MGRIIAIDYGTKRTGLAVTDPGQMIASPMETVHSAELIGFLKTYMATEDVECIVVGEPKQKDGTASSIGRIIDNFVKNLKKKFPGLSIVRMDERYTSKMASRAIAESGLKKKARQDKSLVDKVSAAIILQSFMEMRDLKN